MCHQTGRHPAGPGEGSEGSKAQTRGFRPWWAVAVKAQSRSVSATIVMRTPWLTEFGPAATLRATSSPGTLGEMAPDSSSGRARRPFQARSRLKSRLRLPKHDGIMFRPAPRLFPTRFNAFGWPRRGFQSATAAGGGKPYGLVVAEYFFRVSGDRIRSRGDSPGRMLSP